MENETCPPAAAFCETCLVLAVSLRNPLSTIYLLRKEQPGRGRSLHHRLWRPIKKPCVGGVRQDQRIMRSSDGPTRGGRAGWGWHRKSLKNGLPESPLTGSCKHRRSQSSRPSASASTLRTYLTNVLTRVPAFEDNGKQVKRMVRDQGSDEQDRFG